MARPITVDQRENGTGDFWFAVAAGNGETVLTSKMFSTRPRAKRAARAFIQSVTPAPVRFTFWSGPTPLVRASGRGRGVPRRHAIAIGGVRR